MLNSYLQRTRLIINDPTFAKLNDFDVASYVNTARGQIAGEAECIRLHGTLAIVANTQEYPFTSITLSGSTGVAGVINVRMVSAAVPGANGQIKLIFREWEYFNDFFLCQPVVNPGPPTTYTQFGQGVNGTLFVNLPDLAYTLSLDTVCYPSPLAFDTDPEAIPYLWTDAVPYFAAYLAMLAQQNADGAEKMLQLYQLFLGRARQYATSSVLPGQYSQGPDPMMPNRLGVQMKAG